MSNCVINWQGYVADLWFDDTGNVECVTIVTELRHVDDCPVANKADVWSSEEFQSLASKLRKNERVRVVDKLHGERSIIDVQNISSKK